MAITPQSVFKLGKATILVPDDEFADGYANGFVIHPEAGQPLTVETIRRIITQSVFDTMHPDDWNMGYIVGALDGIRRGEPSTHDPDARQVRLSGLTLRLDDWRFREGYITGQEDYAALQDERTDPSVLSARDLLRYIAHRDRETNRYYFGEEDLATLEEMLGQLVGYLCAALFSTQQQNAEPSPVVTSHKA
jgi:hypothetical protein